MRCSGPFPPAMALLGGAVALLSLPFQLVAVEVQFSYQVERGRQKAFGGFGIGGRPV
jgi:hypothetical protein